jgi:hypothetical protein
MAYRVESRGTAGYSDLAGKVRPGAGVRVRRAVTPGSKSADLEAALHL